MPNLKDEDIKMITITETEILKQQVAALQSELISLNELLVKVGFDEGVATLRNAASELLAQI